MIDTVDPAVVTALLACREAFEDDGFSPEVANTALRALAAAQSVPASDDHRRLLDCAEQLIVRCYTDLPEIADKRHEAARKAFGSLALVPHVLDRELARLGFDADPHNNHKGVPA